MVIFDIYKNPQDGQLHCILEDRIIAVSGREGRSVGPNDILTKVVSNYGTNDPMHIVVRTTMQTQHLLGASKLAQNPTKKEELLLKVGEVGDRLLTMLDCLLYLWDEAIRCEKEFVVDNGRIDLPQIRSLTEKSETFLHNGKLAVAELSKVLQVFFGYSKTGHNYDEHYEWARLNFGTESPITAVLQDHNTGDRWIQNLCGLRNRVEHPKENYWIKFQNIEFDPTSGKMTLPVWFSDEAGPINILSEMEILLNNALVMTEDLIAGCIMETMAVPRSEFCIARIPTDQINLEMPFRLSVYRIGPVSKPFLEEEEA